jgi:GTPase
MRRSGVREGRRGKMVSVTGRKILGTGEKVEKVHFLNLVHTLLKHSACSTLQIGANAGIVGMTKEHLGLALALNVPVFVVVTKIDMCPPNVLEETLKMLNRMLRSQGCRKVPIMIKSVDDVVMGAKNMLCER